MKTQPLHDLIVGERALLGQLLASLDERDWRQGWSPDGLATLLRHARKHRLYPAIHLTATPG